MTKNKKKGIFGGNVNTQAFDNIGKKALRENIQILPELRDLIPPLSSEEYNHLKNNIDKEGVREPILVWNYHGKNVIIDGHNRYNIVKELKLGERKWSLEERQFSDLEEVKDWMILNQLGRRNLTNENASYLRGLLYNNTKKRIGAQQGNLNAKQIVQNAPIEINADQKKQIVQNAPIDSKELKSTAEKIAEKMKVSSDTIKRDAKYAEGLEKISRTNPEIKAKILSGDLKIKKSDIQAVGSDKKSVGELLKPKPQTQEDIPNTFNSKQLNTIEDIKSEITDLMEKLKNVGLDSKSIKGIFQDEIKRL